MTLLDQIKQLEIKRENLACRDDRDTSICAFERKNHRIKIMAQKLDALRLKLHKEAIL